MIDCVFLLLLYFISAAQIKVEEKYLGLMVPGASARRAVIAGGINIGHSENNQVFCNDIPMDTRATVICRRFAPNLSNVCSW